MNKSSKHHSFHPEKFITPTPLVFRSRHGDVDLIGSTEPTWLTAEEQLAWTSTMRDQRITSALGWYNYTQKRKTAIDFFYRIFENYPYRSAMLKHLKKGISAPPIMPGWYCRMATMGLVLNIAEKRFIAKHIRKMLKLASTIADQTDSALDLITPLQKPNIQDYLTVKVRDTFAAIESEFDTFITSGYQSTELMKILFDKAPPTNKIKELIKLAEYPLAELNEVVNGRDDQLNEAYKPYGKRGVKKMIEFWQQAISDISNYGLAKKKSQAPRKRKVVSAEKMVAKLNYLKIFDELKLTSIDPTTIIRSSELWVYNVKTRKLGMYVVSATSSSFEVKGKKILNIDPAVSTQKTLRKPKEQLAEFSVMGKSARRTWFKKIKSTEIKLKNSISKDSILLLAAK